MSYPLVWTPYRLPQWLSLLAMSGLYAYMNIYSCFEYRTKKQKTKKKYILVVKHVCISLGHKLRTGYTNIATSLCIQLFSAGFFSFSRMDNILKNN